MKKTYRKIPAILTALIVAVSAIALMSFSPASVSFANEASDTAYASEITNADSAEVDDTVLPQTDAATSQTVAPESTQPADDPSQAENPDTVQADDPEPAQTPASDSVQPAMNDAEKSKPTENNTQESKPKETATKAKTDNNVSLQEAFSAKDGKYYVDIALFDADKDEAAAWSAVLKNNSRAYVTVSDNKITTVEIATNPAKRDKYESAVTKMQIGSTALKAAKTADFTTLPADKDIQYIVRTSFTMPDSGQPDLQDSETFVPVKLVIPDVDSKNTDKETWQDARLKFSWKTLESTDDKELKQDATIASSDNLAFISAAPALIIIDAGKSVSLKAKVINGKDYELKYEVDNPDIAAISNGKVEAAAPGKAVITITATKTEDGKITDTLTRKVKVIVKEPSYSITVTDDGNGTASADPKKGTEGTKVTLTASPAEGYQFKEWQVVSGGVSITDNSFTIGTSDVEVKAVFEEIPVFKYKVTLSVEGNGSAVADPAEGPEGTEVTLTATPAEGYKFKEWQVVSGGVSITDNKFPIGTDDVEIKAVFEEASQSKTYTDQKTNIVVTDNTGILPSGAKLVVTEITSGSDYDKVNNSTYVAGKPFKLYDIHFEDKNGTKLSPEGRFTINIPIPSSFSKSSLMLIHYYDSGRVTSVSGTVSGDMYKFTTKSFSNFALVDKSSVQPTTKQQPTTKKNTPTTKKNTATTKKSTNAKTGDEANTMMWVALLVIAAAAIAAILIIKRRQTSR